MDIRSRASGLWAFLPTPHDAGALAAPLLVQMVQGVIANAYPVICVGGVIAEGERLTPEESAELTRLTVQAVAGAATVVATVYEGSGATVAAKAARQLGADAVLLVHRQDASPRDLLREIRDATDGLPVVVYDIAARQLDLGDIQGLLAIGNVVGLKDGQGDARRFRRIREAFPDILTVAAWEDLALPYWALGSDAFAPASAAYSPWYAPLWFAALSLGDVASARQVLRAHAYPISDLRRSRDGLSLAVVREACERAGLALGPPRSEGTMLTRDEDARLTAVLDALDQLRTTGDAS